VHFPLHPETPIEGLALKDLFAGIGAEKLAAMKLRMKDLMQQAGLPYGDRTMTYNSRLAQELGKWADSVAGKGAGGNAEIHDLLYRAYFVENMNIADEDNLVAIAQRSGLNGESARKVLLSREFKQAVDDDWQRAYQLGVTGVPTFFSNDLVVVGCQPYEVLERFVNTLLTNNKQSV